MNVSPCPVCMARQEGMVWHGLLLCLGSDAVPLWNRTQLLQRRPSFSCSRSCRPSTVASFCVCARGMLACSYISYEMFTDKWGW
jgi:hypothetical protein